MVGFYQESVSGDRRSFDTSVAPAAAAEPVKGDRQVRLLEIVNVLEGALDLFEEVPLALAHFSAGLADDEVVDRPLEYKLVVPALAVNPQFLNDAERLQHLKIAVDA